ncbi:histidine phosphatase family protein [Bacillus sp. KH172YL63]|uniref:histidine phosphatase family protein n=1 Tax=Bacillus sp. KH172YL63 TaxID=2709784 RepID=UPI0013E481FB|nr:histidine phosphatase family protein [Bacillus sp. KH172YL63]BCB04304.1 putative phosphatase PhoE [Bacillus sp. KH172YL63]
MTQICMVRHGQTDWNLVGKLQGQTDIPLNETGKRQARECRDFLQHHQWDALVTTSLLRARETAEIINEALGLNIVECDQFKERSFGLGEGMLREDRMRDYPDFIFPEMETYEDLVARIGEGLAFIQTHFPGQKVLIVAHGAVISSVLKQFHGNEVGDGHVKLFNGCFTDIHYEGGSWMVRKYNQVSHLSEHA